MSRLLYAGFVRVKKDPLVRMGMIIMVILSVFLVLFSYYTGIKEKALISLDDILYVYLVLIGLMSAVFCSYLSGQEYSDGVIRNKLAAGHTRVSIYVSNLIINVSVVCGLWLISLLTQTVLGIWLLDGIQTDAREVFVTLLASLLTLIALCAIFTMIALAGQNYKASDAVCLMIACTLSFAAIYLMLLMVELKNYDDAVADGVEVIVQKDEAIYPVIHHRKTYEFIYDLLPSGQIAQYISKDIKHPERLPWCSAGIIVVTTSLGIVLLQRKNIQ